LKNGKCACFEGCSGNDCSIISYVNFFDCGYKCTFDNGYCLLNNTKKFNRYFSCQCKEGYMGAHCGIPICKSKCNFNGDCISAENCSCYEGFSGVNCEIDCGCNGHGKCNPETNKTCICDPGFKYNPQANKCEFSCSCEKCIGPNECAFSTDECKHGI
jgi:hypothetical protein